MKVAAYTSSLNDKVALRRCITALQTQSVPVQEIIVVDNASTDGTQSESLPDNVTLICHYRNLGTSGAVVTAFEYAMEKNYDWLWVLDQDSIPRPDALERLLDVLDAAEPAQRDRIGILCSVALLQAGDRVAFRHFLTPTGTVLSHIDWDLPDQPCDTARWSGSLYRLSAARQVGMPLFGMAGPWDQLNLDWGDLEYGYRIRRAGWKVRVVTTSIIDHNVGKVSNVRRFGRQWLTSNHSAFRRYLYFRNMFYFWLYIHPDRRLLPIAYFLQRYLLVTLAKILIAEENRWAKTKACVRGAIHGISKRLDRSG